MVDSPYINSKDVKAALEDLIRAPGERRFAGLRWLLLVDLQIGEPGTPASDRLRDYAVREVLVDQITSAYAEQRALFNLARPDLRASLDQAMIDLDDDMRVNASELVVWSVLYHRCVRTDLNLSVETLAKQLGMSTRNITRCTDSGVELLTPRLIHAEKQARLEQLQRSLYAALPVSVPVNLLGRDSWIEQALQLLPTLSPCHVLVTGAPGIGKTVVVQELMRKLIDDKRLDQLIWIEHPRSVRSMRQQLTEGLLREAGAVKLRDHCLMYSVAVVLDGIGMVSTEWEAFEALMRDLGAALVCLINRTPVSLATVAAHLPVGDIDRSWAYELVHQTLPYDEADRWMEIVPYVYEQVGGNPMALRLIAGMISDIDELTFSVQDELFGRLFTELDVSERQVWCALALFPQAAPLSDLYTLWGFVPELARALTRYHLAQGGENQTCLLLDAARDYLRRCYDSSGEMRTIFDELVVGLQPQTAPFYLLENILTGGLPKVDLAVRETWINALWPEGIKRGHWARWREILEDHAGQMGVFDPAQRIAYGVCLRHLGDWSGAQQVFRILVKEMGAVGDFTGQAQAMIEWAILAQHQGDYQQAAVLVGEVSHYAERSRDSELLYKLHLQEVRLAVQAQRGVEAADLLDTLPETPQVLALRSEAQLALKNYPACRSLAEQALALINDDLAAEASLNTIIGRSYEAKRDYEQARRYFTEAVTLFQRLNDGYALARAQTNLAAVLIRLGEADQDGEWLHQAADLLAQAELVQQRLGDKVGLSATKHNQSILGGHIPS